MSYKIRTKYTKPSAGVSLHTTPAGLTKLINTMFAEGKITQKPVESIDGLNYTFETIFANEEAYNEYNNQAAATENYNTRVDHCSTNSIVHSVEVGVQLKAYHPLQQIYSEYIKDFSDCNPSDGFKRKKITKKPGEA